ncbi:MAG: DNA-3-methyladenine glycosylase [Armatimonadaceae bacterium]
MRKALPRYTYFGYTNNVNREIPDPLPVSFYEQPTLTVARSLLGKSLVRTFDSGDVAIGRIVETEAYTENDPACHSFRGMTPSNRAMFGPPGTVYVHINYGIHFCLNIVTQAEGKPEAVLIRAIEPTENATILYQNYFGVVTEEETARRERRIAAGPGRLTKALGITRDMQGHQVTQMGGLYIVEGEAIPDEEIVTTTRIGITRAADYPWRFYIRSSRFVSRR